MAEILSDVFERERQAVDAREVERQRQAEVDDCRQDQPVEAESEAEQRPATSTVPQLPISSEAEATEAWTIRESTRALHQDTCVQHWARGDHRALNPPSTQNRALSTKKSRSNTGEDQ